jgi:hypothetical protein
LEETSQKPVRRKKRNGITRFGKGRGRLESSGAGSAPGHPKVTSIVPAERNTSPKWVVPWNVVTAVRARAIGIIYALYFIVAVASAGGGVWLQLVSTGVYAIFVLLIARAFFRWNPVMAAAAAFAGLAGCILQGHGIAEHSMPLKYAALAMFGAFCVLLGCLIVAKPLVPRVLGVLMIVAGVGWLTFLAPPVALPIARYTEIVGGIAELALMLWLLVRGIDPATRSS